jgi:hypothetical protein
LQPIAPALAARSLPSVSEAVCPRGADVNAEPVTVRRSGRRIGLGLLVATTLLTSACAAGQDSQTANEKPTHDGTDASVGKIYLRGLAIQAPTGSEFYAKGSDALVRLVIVNIGTSTDTLTGITSSSITGWSAFPRATDASTVQAADAQAATSPTSTSPTTSAPATSSSADSGGASGTSSSSAAAPTSSAPALPAGAKTVTIAPNSRVSWGVPDAAGALLLKGIKSRVYPGSAIRLTFTFTRAGSVRVTVPVAITDTPGTAVVPGPSATGQQG